MYREKVTKMLNEIDKQNPVGSSMREMLLNAVETGFEKFVDYQNACYTQETRMQVAKYHTNSVEEFQALAVEYDKARRICHEAAIASVNMWNRICDKYGIDRVYVGSDDRTEIGDFCGEFVNEYFKTRTHARVIDKEEINHVISEEIEFER